MGSRAGGGRIGRAGTRTHMPLSAPPPARPQARHAPRRQVVCDWLEAVGLEPLPHGVAWNLLRIDSALLACWEEEEEEKASPAPLECFPSYAEASDAVTPPSRPLHHPAWLPLALLMARRHFRDNNRELTHTRTHAQ